MLVGRIIRSWRRAGCLLAASLLIAGCGERVFTEEEFVEAINAEGAAVELGEVITTNEEGVDVRAVTLTENEVSPTGAEGQAHGSGAMVVLENAGAAEDELERCESAPAFTCFRAANVVLRFEGLLPEDRARITAAFQALAAD